MEDRVGMCSRCKKRDKCTKLCTEAEEYADQDQVTYLLHGGRLGLVEEEKKNNV